DPARDFLREAREMIADTKHQVVVFHHARPRDQKQAVYRKQIGSSRHSLRLRERGLGSLSWFRRDAALLVAFPPGRDRRSDERGEERVRTRGPALELRM